MAPLLGFGAPGPQLREPDRFSGRITKGPAVSESTGSHFPAWVLAGGIVRWTTYSDGDCRAQ
jgi:hypothetical protein